MKIYREGGVYLGPPSDPHLDCESNRTANWGIIASNVISSSSLAVGDADQDPLDIRFGHVVNSINTDTEQGRATECLTIRNNDRVNLLLYLIE